MSEEKEGRVVQKKFSDFSSVSGEGIEGVGLKDGQNVRFNLTTDAISVNPNPFRNAKGQFIGTPEELDGLKNQRDVNEFLYNAISDIESGDVNLDGYATEEWVNEQLEGPTQEEKLALIEAQIQFRGLMELDADEKPLWPADQTKDRGGWWAYPTSSTSSGWNYNALQWIFPHYGEVSEGVDEVTKQAAPKYQVGDIIQLQVIENEAGAGTSWRYIDTAPVFVEYRVEEVYYPDRLSGNSNNYYPAYRVSMSGPDHRYTGRLPSVVKGPQGDPSDAWIQWYPTTFAFGAAVPEGDFVSKTGGDSMEGPLTLLTPEGADGRATKRLETLGVFSGSDKSALRLGTNRDRVYIGNDDTSFNGPIKISEIQEKTADEGVLLANQTALAEEGTETNHLITKGYVDGADQRLQGEIEQIALGLEALLTQRTVGQWAYDGTVESGPPRTAGTFKALADMSAEANYLALHAEDANGVTHGFSDAEVGDYIEIVDMDNPDVYALYVLTAEAVISDLLVELPVRLKDRGADFEIGDSCTIRQFTINEENINLSELDDRYLKLTGGTLTGTLNAPKLETKTENGPAAMLIEGYKGNTDVAARLTMSNRWNANANGALTFHGLNASAWFAFNKDLDMNSKGIHSVNRIKFTGGDKALMDGNTSRILLNERVTIPKAGDSNVEGFAIKGKTKDGENENLLSLYHNENGLDAINYRGKQEGPFNVATVGYVSDAIAAIDLPKPTLPEWTMTHFKFDDLQPGKMSICDGDLNGINNLENARGIVFSAIDANGNRLGRNKDGVDWQRDFGGVLNILYDEEKTMLTMARSHGSAPSSIYYVAEFDAYMIIWPTDKDAVVTSDITHVVFDQNYKIHCPEIFF